MLGILLLTLTASTAGTFFSPPVLYASSGDLQSFAAVVETNDGQIVYLAQVQSSSSTSYQIYDFINFLSAQGLSTDEYSFSSSDDGTVSFMLGFDSYQSYYNFSGVNLTSTANRTIETKTSLFFIERTITLSDPYERFFDPSNNKAAAILDKFNEEFNASEDSHVDYGYSFSSTFRRTQVNSYKNDFSPADGIWQYYFNVSSDPTDPDAAKQIIIFDRFANTPIWYGIALAAALLFMVGMYVVLSKKSKHKNETSGTTAA